jgi:hypothetical protein
MKATIYLALIAGFMFIGDAYAADLPDYAERQQQKNERYAPPKPTPPPRDTYKDQQRRDQSMQHGAGGCTPNHSTGGCL